jgi:hypothetical protein
MFTFRVVSLIEEGPLKGYFATGDIGTTKLLTLFYFFIIFFFVCVLSGFDFFNFFSSFRRVSQRANLFGLSEESNLEEAKKLREREEDWRRKIVIRNRYYATVA